MTQMRRGHPAAIFGLAGVVLAASIAVTAHAQAPIRIGASLSQTGSYANLGENRLRAYQLCVKDANQKGGVLGRKIELVVEDDQSNPKVATEIYERLITQRKVDAVLGPYSSPITDAVADVTERHKLPLLALAATASMYKKGRKFIFMVPPPAEAFLEGLMDAAAKRGLKSVVIVYEDTLFPKSVALGAMEFAKARGLQIARLEAYPKGLTDFAPLLDKIRELNPDVLAAATYFDDAVAIARQMRAQNVDVRMFGVTVGGDLPKFQTTLGKDAEFVYGAAQWEPELVTLRAGGLVPIARQFPGAREFVEAYQKEFPGADISYHSASGYAGCQILLEAIKGANSIDGEKVRDTILKMEINTVFGGFKVDSNGVQTVKKMVMFQWQDGKKVIVWPEDLAPDRPRFPTPPWSQRR